MNRTVFKRDEIISQIIELLIFNFLIFFSLLLYLLNQQQKTSNTHTHIQIQMKIFTEQNKKPRKILWSSF